MVSTRTMDTTDLNMMTINPGNFTFDHWGIANAPVVLKILRSQTNINYIVTGHVETFPEVIVPYSDSILTRLFLAIGTSWSCGRNVVHENKL